MVAINVNTVSAKVEKYKMITVGDNNPSFAALLPMKSYVGQMKGLTMPRGRSVDMKLLRSR
jgi:hypothetical protein